MLGTLDQDVQILSFCNVIYYLCVCLYTQFWGGTQPACEARGKLSPSSWYISGTEHRVSGLCGKCLYPLSHNRLLLSLFFNTNETKWLEYSSSFKTTLHIVTNLLYSMNLQMHADITN